MASPKLCKTKRTALLAQQHQQCVLCSTYLSNTAHARHDDKHNYMLCPACMLLMSSFRTIQERGIQLQDIIEYEERNPQDDPVIKSDRRLAVETGRLAYDGHVVDPDTRGWVDKVTGEPVSAADLNRPFKDWDEALALHPDWKIQEDKLNNV